MYILMLTRRAAIYWAQDACFLLVSN